MIRKVLLIAAVTLFSGNAQTFTATGGINGVYVRKLHKPATGEIRTKAFAAASDSLKRSLYEWMTDNVGNPPDTANPILSFHFNVFGDTCLSHAQQDSYLEGREWTVTYSLSPDTATQLLVAHNARCDSLAAAYWNLAQEGQKFSRWPVVYNGGIHALFYSMGNFGPAASNPTLTASREAVQELMNKLKVRYDDVIIKGKPGYPIEKPITVTATIDSLPLAGMILTATLPTGQELITLSTNSEGVASFADLQIPFVPYGAFLHIRPNFGAIVNPEYDFIPEPFGIELSEGQDQTLIFNIVTQTYTLDYSANAAASLKMPAELASGNLVRKFFQDSCHLTPVASGQKPDLAITLQLQATSYTYDELEETRLKTEMHLVVNQSGENGSEVDKALVVHEKSYDINHTLPLGLYFWETGAQLRDVIRQSLNEL